MSASALSPKDVGSGSSAGSSMFSGTMRSLGMRPVSASADHHHSGSKRDESPDSLCNLTVRLLVQLMVVVGPSKIAKRAVDEKKTVRDLCEELDVLPAADLDRILDPATMTAPGIPS